MKRLWGLAREPVNAYTHLAGAALALGGGIALCARVARSGGVVWPFAVYAASLVTLFAASGTYHLCRVGPRALERLRKLDHAAIFVLIAGTQTPVAWLALDGAARTALLAAVWGVALAGVAYKAFTVRGSRWVTTLAYVVMGWLVAPFLPRMTRALSAAAVWWMLAGGALYLVGAIVYATKRPDWRPGVFGFHEVWHVFVLGGAAAHFAMVARLVS